MSASASATRSSKTTFPSSVEMSRVTDCLLRPRYFHQSPTPSFWGPKWRRWSPVSGCSTLITSAPKSASRRPTVPIEIIDPASITVTPSRAGGGVIVGRRVVGSGPAVGGRVATHKGLPGVSTPPWAVRAVRSVAVRVLCPVISGLCGSSRGSGLRLVPASGRRSQIGRSMWVPYPDSPTISPSS